MKMSYNSINHFLYVLRGVTLFSSVPKVILKHSRTILVPAAVDLKANWFESRISWDLVTTLRAISTQGLTAIVAVHYTSGVKWHLYNSFKFYLLALSRQFKMPQSFYLVKLFSYPTFPSSIWSLTFTRYLSCIFHQTFSLCGGFFFSFHGLSVLLSITVYESSLGRNSHDFSFSIQIK